MAWLCTCCFLKCHGSYMSHIISLLSFSFGFGTRKKACSIKQNAIIPIFFPMSKLNILLDNFWASLYSSSQTCQTKTSGILSTPAGLGRPCNWCPWSVLCLFLWLSGGPLSVVASTSDIDEWAGVHTDCWARCLAWTWTTVLWFSETPVPLFQRKEERLECSCGSRSVSLSPLGPFWMLFRR